MNLAGTWLSHYEYNSNRRGWNHSGHIVTIIHFGTQITIGTKPHTSPSTVRMHLTATDNTLTGTWTETTDPDGDYAGRQYSGLIMLTISPDEDTLTGFWIGPGADGEINVGPWKLTRLHH